MFLRRADDELSAAKDKAQQQERRATAAEAELREARHALRELALQLPVCERLVADLRADSAPSSESAIQGAGATGPALSREREAELEQQLAQVRPAAPSSTRPHLYLCLAPSDRHPPPSRATRSREQALEAVARVESERNAMREARDKALADLARARCSTIPRMDATLCVTWRLLHSCPQGGDDGALQRACQGW